VNFIRRIQIGFASMSMTLSKSRRPKVLFVAMADSIHAAKYIEILSDAGWDIHLFPVYPCIPHPRFKNITIWNGFSSYKPPHTLSGVRMMGVWPFRLGKFKIGSWIGSVLNRFGFDAAWRLSWLIRYLKPDVVHSLEFQLAGYLVDRVKKIHKGEFPLWITTNWGSDIYAYGKLPEHADKIRSVLSAADVYTSECFRDVILAKEFGFTGSVMPVVPNAGGFDLKASRRLASPGPTSRRKVIAVKGYQYSFGRSLVALRALERTSHLLRDYRIVMYSPYPKDVVDIPARLMAIRSGLNVELMEQAPHEEILKLHGSARISISLSISDAICTSMTEAMVMGSFPIQSDTACAEEWVEDGRSALLVNADDSDDVAAKVALALADDELVDEAARINAITASERLDASAIKADVLSAYRNVLAGRIPKNAELP
jgi:glycosyltransferase involved in cell wall biosynthesis